MVSQSSSNYVSGSGGGSSYSSVTNYYTWYDGALQSAITQANSGSGGNTNWSTSFGYDGMGRLVSAYVADGKPRSIAFTNDELGQIIRRDESAVSGQTGAPHETWYRFGGRQLGYTGNNGTSDLAMAASIDDRRTAAPSGSQGTFRNKQLYGGAYADFAQNYDPLNSYSQGSAGGSYTVQRGDTLQAIARNLWGDAGLWYKLAEANGLGASTALIEGQRLTLPTGVVRNTNRADTMRPYDPAGAIGDVTPGTAAQAKKAKNKCGTFGLILLAVVAIAVTVVSAGAAVAALGPAGTSLGAGISTVLGTAGGIGVGAAAAAAGTGISTAAFISAGAISGAIGSIASQALGVATGIQEKFSWKGVALSALSGAVGAGVGPKGLFGGDGLFGKGIVAAAARGAVSSAVVQSVGVATGLQDKFSWAGVAAAGIGAGVANWVGSQVGGQLGSKFGESLLSNAASGIANAATRSVIEGTDFGDNILAALPDIIGNTLGNALASQLSASGPIQIDPKIAALQFQGLKSDPVVRRTLVAMGVQDPDIDFLTPGQFLDLLSGGARGSQSTVTRRDIDTIRANVGYLLTSMADRATDQSSLGRALARNNGIRLLYSSLIIEMPNFQWTHVGMFVGGEVVRNELINAANKTETVKSLVDSGFAALGVITGPIGDLIGEGLNQISQMTASGLSDHIIDKISMGHVTVAADIGSYALAYRAAGGSGDAAIKVARVLPGGPAREGMTLQYRSDQAAARGNSVAAASFGRDAAIQLGIAEQTRLQEVLWNDGVVSAFSRVMASAQMINADIPVPALGPNTIIRDPSTQYSILGGTFRFPRVWDLDYRIGVAKNAFNTLSDWVHAPMARGDGSAAGRLNSYVRGTHWESNTRPYRAPGSNDAWGRGFRII